MYSFEPNLQWSSTFAPGAEIYEYFRNVAEKYNVVETIPFNEGVSHCDFADGIWTVKTTTGRHDEAQVIIAATGVLHHPKFPDIAGLDRFAGPCFHSAQWDHSVDVANKRVGVIGTGSTAIQITGALVDKVAQFALFQRTAQWIMPGENLPYSEQEIETFRRDAQKLDALRAQLDKDFQKFANAVIDAEPAEMVQIEAACLANLEDNVRDPELRKKRRPNYRAACKRLIFSGDFYDSIQHPNSEVVTSEISRVEPGGVRTEDGELHELDVLVLATGFHADRFIRLTAVEGRGGVNLDDVWADHPVAYLSISIREFPNFFMLNGPNGPVGNFSLIQIAESQVSYVLQLIGQIRARKCREISANARATAEFEATRSAAAKNSIWATGCKSWYLDNNGVPASWPWTPSRFFEEMASPKIESFDQVN